MNHIILINSGIGIFSAWGTVSASTEIIFRILFSELQFNESQQIYQSDRFFKYKKRNSPKFDHPTNLRSLTHFLLKFQQSDQTDWEKNIFIAYHFLMLFNFQIMFSMQAFKIFYRVFLVLKNVKFCCKRLTTEWGGGGQVFSFFNYLPNY